MGLQLRCKFALQPSQSALLMPMTKFQLLSKKKVPAVSISYLQKSAWIYNIDIQRVTIAPPPPFFIIA